MSVCAFSTLPDFSVTRVGATEATISPSITSTPRLRSRRWVYVRMSDLNIGNSAFPASTSIRRASSCGSPG